MQKNVWVIKKKQTSYFKKKTAHISRGGFRGGGRTPSSLPSGIRPPADPKGPPFDTFSEIHFWPTDPKMFLKAPLAPIYTNFEGERAPKNKRFFCQNFFKKRPKTAFLTVFFLNLPAAQKLLPSPPRENPRSAPAYQGEALNLEVW